MQAYKVKLIDGHTASHDQIIDGYLGNSFGDGKIQLYTLGGARDKARLFSGKAEAHGKKFTTSKVSMLQFAASELSDGVKNLLGQKIVYSKENGGYDTIHYGCVFSDILTEQGKWVTGFDFDEEVADIVEELSILDILSTHYEYVQILGEEPKKIW